MNVIFILCDTLVRDKLSPYHSGEGPYGHIRTPNIERFAQRGTTFTNHWINSAPCMPARRDLWSGRIEFPWRSGGPLYQYGTDLGEKWVGLKPGRFDRYEGAEVGPFMPHTDRPVYRVPSDGLAYSHVDADIDALFDMVRDPDCRHNLYAEDGALRSECLERLAAAMADLDVPSEHFERLGLTRRTT